MNNEELERNWKKFGLVNEMADTVTPLTDMYAKCLGQRDGGVAFLIDGMKEDKPRSVTIFKVDQLSNCWDLAEGGMYIGSLLNLEVEAN